MGSKVDIGWDVFLDVHYAKYLTIEDDVWITNKAIIFCHREEILTITILGIDIRMNLWNQTCINKERAL